MPSQRKPYTLHAALALALVGLAHPVAACYDGAGPHGPKRFIVKGDEAQDGKTGLIWKRCSLGTRLGTKAERGNRCAGEKAFVNLDRAVQLAKAEGNGWHVPSGPELESLIDVTCGSPVVDASVFPDIAPDDEGTANYWTTNEVGAANLIYYFDFMTGRADGHGRGFQLAVRLVRGGK
jgi:Protein of unknown function (DUF1566)